MLHSKKKHNVLSKITSCLNLLLKINNIAASHSFSSYFCRKNLDIGHFRQQITPANRSPIKPPPAALFFRLLIWQLLPVPSAFSAQPLFSSPLPFADWLPSLFAAVLADDGQLLPALVVSPTKLSAADVAILNF